MNEPQSPLQKRVLTIVESAVFRTIVLILILVNAVILGAETFNGLSANIKAWLHVADATILAAFVVEISLRFFALRGRFFRDGWNIFDALIIFVSIAATTSGLAALRAFRVLRVLRVITVIPRMRIVVSALLDSLPGIASVGVVLTLILYVFAVIAANLYGAAHPGYFGDVLTAMQTLFQVMTLEGWPDIASAVEQTHPRSWIFFLSFLLLATFTMLNLFVAIVVRVVEEETEPDFGELLANQRAMLDEVKRLRAELAAISKKPPQ